MKDYLNITETAKELNISRPTVYLLIKRGRLTPFRNPAYVASPGGPVRIPRQEVEALKPVTK